ncbi:putative 7-deoxyloganetin glucosyltransferase [Helianthus debilis subsp. tardiflorus]
MDCSNKPHAVLVPYPAQGHVTPFMKLAKLLHSHGFHITFVNTEFNHWRLIRSKGPESVKGVPGFRFETIPDGMPHSDRDATQDVPMLCDMTRKTCLGPFKELLCRLNLTDGVPKVSCVIGDGVMSFAIKAARDLGIPEVQFWTSPACAFMCFLHYREFVKRGIVPFKDDSYLTDGTLEKPIDWIPGVNNLRYKDIPSFIRTTDPNDIMFDFMGEEAQNNLNAPAIIFNTFDALEHKVVKAIASKFNYPNIYTIGPLPLLAKYVPDESPVQSLNSSLWRPDSSCFQWLDQKKEESVIYINYGSITTMTNQHFVEFAWGLANSMQPFLWVVRPDVTMGDSTSLPEEFLEGIKDRGMLISWCDQEKVLAHPSVGAFLSHCGWNSTTESILEGVPLICWPFFSDQQTNCGFACNEWGIGMEINHDVKRNEVEVLVREMMQGEKGKEMRRNAKEWKRKAREATEIGGSSYNNFQKFIKQELHYHI